MNAGDAAFVFSDLALARRLERAEALSNVAFVEARAQMSPDVGATWIESGGAYAMYDGVGSPCTQTFALGMSEPISEAQLARFEDFFTARGAAVDHEISPMAHPSALALLAARGYEPIELTSVMWRPVARSTGLTSATLAAGITVRRVGQPEHDLWADVAARGWGEHPELSSFMREIAAVIVSRRDTVCFIAELEGRPMATGALSISDGVALLAGACTVPEGRRRGAQVALLDTRLRFAAEQAGCDLAMMCAAPGSTSQRNAERNGFRIAYTRTKWRRRTVQGAGGS
jgi:hypothetical protein